MTKKAFYQISLKVILKNDKGEVLVLNGHPRGSFTGFYDLPGGQLEGINTYLDIDGATSHMRIR